MPEPRFLGLERVLRLHRILINEYGGSHGVRDLGLLGSAIAQPSTMFGNAYLHSDLFEMAAAYLYHVVQNHPFIDGNKRVGSATAIIFLELNGIEIEADEDGLVDISIAVASGTAYKPEIAEFFRSRVVG
jgi:death-on-curing protein